MDLTTIRVSNDTLNKLNQVQLDMKIVNKSKFKSKDAVINELISIYRFARGGGSAEEIHDAYEGN